MQQKSQQIFSSLELEFSFINYKEKDVEGECLLKTIQGIRFNRNKFILFIILNIVLIGAPSLICYWYVSIKRWFYYQFSNIEDATHFYILNYDNQYTINPKYYGEIYKNDLAHQQCYYFINRFLKYYYDNQAKQFIAVTYDFIPRINKIVNQTEKIKGLSEENVLNLMQCFGKSVMEIPVPSYSLLFVRQILQPFFIFIVYSVILWYYELYLYYASIIVLISGSSILINLIQIMDLNRKIFRMAFYQTKINVLRQSRVIELSSIDIVPGDLVFLKKTMKLPFDGVLLAGSLLINESALTGESLPIVKKAIDKQQFNQKKNLDKSCLLYEGTEMIQICSKSRNPAHQQFQQFGLMVCVIRTNFTTTKGQLIRIISFPKGRDIRFYVESAKFILFLFCLSIISYIFLIIKQHNTVTGSDLALKFFDLITITVPPGLPASMSIGIGYSLHRLGKSQIYCISPDKIILGGRIQHICFDKTGTLTQEYMDFYQFIPKVKKNFLHPINLQNRDQPQNIQILRNSQDTKQALNNMATCHSIMRLLEHNKLTGDPMQIKLFQFGNFHLTENSSVSKNYRQNLFSFKGDRNQGSVFRRFQFSSQLQRMSAIASTSQQPNSAYVYCKGAPQSMVKIMNPDGIPENYIETLEKYTSCGFRVLTVASRPISLSQIQNMDRQNAEKNLNFNGFEVFQNKLKPETYGAIQILKNASISIVIITGDNVLTGANIGFKSGIIQKQKNIMICDLNENNQVKVTNFYEQDNNRSQSYRIVISKQNSQKNFQENKIKTQQDFICDIQQLPAKANQIVKNSQSNYVFCVTGRVFGQIFSQNLDEQKKQFIKNIKVFARSKPIDKTRAIMVYQSLGKITAMCGDGANDCGALKQADAGLSLSEAQASISSPFTSKVPNISSMISLIRQCRGGLATNFSLFNIMALYSLIQYSTTVICEYYYSYPADFQYLYYDLGNNFFFFLTLGYTATVSHLSSLRPNDSLFSLSNILSVFIMFIIQLIGQISVIIIMNKPFNTQISYYLLGGSQNNLNYYTDTQSYNKDTPEVQALFMFSNFMYTFSVIAFSISRPWKKFFITNLPFMIIFVIIFTYQILICLVDKSRIPIFNFNSDKLPLNIEFQETMCGFGMAIGLLMYVNQKHILQPFFGWLKQKYQGYNWI